MPFAHFFGGDLSQKLKNKCSNFALRVNILQTGLESHVSCNLGAADSGRFTRHAPASPPLVASAGRREVSSGRRGVRASSSKRNFCAVFKKKVGNFGLGSPGGSCAATEPVKQAANLVLGARAHRRHKWASFRERLGTSSTTPGQGEGLRTLRFLGNRPSTSTRAWLVQTRGAW